MDVFMESPLEALIFKYLRFCLLTTVNGFWTWVAVITAAVSFWRIRAVGSHSHPHKSGGSRSFHDQRTDGSLLPFVELTPLESSEEPARPCSCTTSVSTVEDDGKTVKGKFTVCYFDEDNDDGECNGNGESTLIGGWSEGFVNGGSLERKICRWESWEGKLAERTGDLGWYRYQDLTVLNGNIVRLWDDVKRKSSPLREIRW